MIDQNGDLLSHIKDVAQLAILRYAQGILTTEELKVQMLQEWGEQRIGEGRSRHSLLTRLAQRICSRALCVAWYSEQEEVRDCAFKNVRYYLAQSLRCSSYATVLENRDALDDVLNQTLMELFTSLERNPSVGLKDPASFIRWTQVAAIRHAQVFVHKFRQNSDSSLEEKEEELAEWCVDERNRDPENEAIYQQLHQTLKDAILTLRNPSHRQIIVCTYLVGMEEQELAHLLGISVQDVYMRRFRALRALRKNPEIIRIFRTWRE